MLNRGCSLLLLCLSLSSFASDMTDMELKVDHLQILRESLPGVNVEAYARELQYEKQELSHDARAQIEAGKIAQELRSQIHTLFQDALLRTGDKHAAYEEISLAIENDLQLIAPDLQDEFRELSFEALRQAEAGNLHSSRPDLKGLENEMRKGSIQRSVYLNSPALAAISARDKLPSVNGSKDAERTEYRSRKELVASLVSDRESSSWFNSAGQDMSSEVSKYTDGDISFRFKTKFLGVAVEAGPVIKVKKEISTRARIVAEGHYPLIRADGNFELIKRDRAGNKLVKNGKPVRRFVAFFCDASLSFSTTYDGSGSFTFMGIGGSVSKGRSVSDSVSMDSRQVFMPQFIDNKTVTMPVLRQICHVDYLKAKIAPNMTLKQAMEINMKNLLAGAIFIHPKTKCATDSHCIGWYKKEKLAILGNKAFPRCVEDKREKYRACIVAARAGQACPVYTKGKLVSRGVNENICDRGLSCVKVKKEGPLFLQYAVGVCKPANARTYKAPPIIR